MRFDEISFKSSIHFWISENSNAVKNDRVEEDLFPPSLLAMPAPRERLHGGVTGGFITVS